MRIKIFDESVLDKELAEYWNDRRGIPQYLIMNKCTLEFLKNKFISSMVKPTPNYHHVYRGIVIATCEKLEDGEVDII